MYVQKKNGVWWARENLSDSPDQKTLNLNLGRDFKKAKKQILVELKNLHPYVGEDYQKKILDKMDEIEKKNPTEFVTLKLTLKQYEKIKHHLPPELQI